MHLINSILYQYLCSVGATKEVRDEHSLPHVHMLLWLDAGGDERRELGKDAVGGIEMDGVLVTTSNDILVGNTIK